MVAVAATVLAGPLLGIWSAAPAAADGYRYWSFWERDGDGWSYATQGPASARPGDGDVVGFRFAVSKDSRDAARPRSAADFDASCAETPGKGGTKRIAVVLDFGTPQDAPDGDRPPRTRTACARIDGDGTAADALASVARPLRYNSAALLCAIAGYPTSGCGEQVRGGGDQSQDSSAAGEAESSGGTGSTSDADGASHTADAPDSDAGDDGPSAGLIGGLVAVVALGAAALWQARRRRG
ncbi:SCO2322 family protein [Streptomyces zagrosensis]|uniref:MYXO-CTERM domain-containing protein n=1 Tax=Streptomyces zagrosensis TaxID=1042984 RepID=A0A7W9Q480_9ACTN|nr:MYXO-CTERM domain-containing protein [Streptomyces zagrosensis]